MLNPSSAAIIETAPLSYFQESLWFLYEMETESSLFNRGVVLHFRGPLDVALLERSLSAMVQRHATLRATIGVEDGVPYQSIHAPVPISLPILEMGGVPEDERPARANEILYDDLRQRFDLATQVGWRARLIRFDERDHYFLFSIHHIYYDGYSVNLIFSDLVNGYKNGLSGEATPLPDPPISYVDFARAQHISQREGFDQALAEWAQRLGVPPPAFTLPTDRPYPPDSNFDVDTLSYTLQAASVRRVREVAQEAGVTLFTVYLSALAGLFHRYTGQEDIVIGVPFSNRTPATKELIGYFINAMPVRLHVTGEMSLLDIARQAGEFMRFAKTNQDIPFKHLVSVVKPPRTRSQHPIFQVMLNRLPFAYDTVTFGDLTIENIVFHVRQELLDLEFRLIEAEQEIRLLCKYNTYLFQPNTIERLASHYESLLEDALSHPNRKAREWRMLSDEELQIALNDWNNTHTDVPRVCAHKQVEEQARRRPQAVAVMDNERQLTYAELWKRVQSLTSRLMRAGVGAGNLVGVCLNRSVELPAALLAVLQAGAAYVPIDPAYPAERVRLIFEDAKPVLCITESALTTNLDWNGIPTLMLDAPPEVEPSFPPPEVSLSSPAYVIYTSGTTGRPKGVQISHGALANLLNVIGPAVGFTESDSLLAITTISFDISNLELFLPLIHGATVFVADHVTASDGNLLKEKLEELRPTWMQATPATWKLLLASGWTGSPDLSILCGGEALPSSLAGELLSSCRALWNVYGPTETTIWATLYPVTRAVENIPIGRPLGNMRAYILDAYHNILPPGVIGDLYLAGAGLGDGYFNQPDQTSKAFLPDPFVRGERMYFTGDRAFYCPDGNIVFHGRNDQQVKVRGFRIELGDVEAAFKQHPNVQDAVAIVQNDAAGDARLMAFFTSQGEPPAVEDLRRFLATKLPSYMLPSLIAQVDSFPLTPAGKVDRKLLASYKSLPEHEPNTAPRTALESRMLDIWKEFLGVEELGVETDFFDAGGHSLMAVRLVARLEEKLGRKIPLRRLVTHPTIRDLARWMELSEHESSAAAVVELRSGQGAPVFLIPAADRTALSKLKMAQQIKPGYRAYGLEYPDTTLENIGPQRIQILTEYFVNLIRSVQQNGPYYVIGSCLGGILAFEVSRRLNTGPEGLVVVIDANAPKLPENLQQRNNLLYYIKRLSFLLRERKLGMLVTSRIRRISSHIQRFLGDEQYRRKMLAGTTTVYPIPEPYSGKALIVLNSLASGSRRLETWELAVPYGDVVILSDTSHFDVWQEHASRAIMDLINKHLP